MQEAIKAQKPDQQIEEVVLFSGSNPEGDTLACNNYYYLKNGKPFYPAMGEIHPMRIDPQFWEDVILKAKNGGLNTVSFYVFWIFIEPAPGVFDFTGRNNIRRFVQLCQKQGMYAIPRIGPFCNAEVAHGGLPSWLYGTPCRERSNDPAYLALVERMYGELAGQLQGLFWKDGGPIIAIQVENEYGHAPALWSGFYPYGGDGLVSNGHDGESHMLKLKALAQKTGFDVPFWTATAWDGSPVPAGEFLPMSGAYTYLGQGGPTEGSCFMEPHTPRTVPFTTCEAGTGCDAHSPWRPHIPPEGAEVVLFTTLAQGSNGCGFYMYAGGSNPVTRQRFFVSDQQYLCMSLISYDFSAPIGEYGLVNDTYRHLRPWLSYLQDAAESFLLTKPVWPEKTVTPEDAEHLRYMVRVDGNRGYLFLNNFQDKLQLPEREHVTVTVTLPDTLVQLPSKQLLPDGMTLAENEMLMLPFGMKIGTAELLQAVATPFCILKNQKAATYVFRKTRKNKACYLFGTDAKITVPKGQKVSSERISTGEYAVTAEPDAWFEVDGVQLLTLAEERVLHTQKVVLLDGSEALLYTRADCVYENGKAVLTAFTPDMTAELWQNGRRKAFARHAQPVQPDGTRLRVLDDIWATCKLKKQDFHGLEDIFLELCFDGDIARVFADGMMVADRLNDGRTWRISLRHLFRQVTEKDGLAIRLLPCTEGKTAMTFDGITYRPVSGEGQKTGYTLLRLSPRYRAVIRF